MTICRRAFTRAGLLLALVGCEERPERVSRLDALRETYVPIADRLVKDVDLVDHDGRRFTDANLEGRYSLVFVGYTSCPDVCPRTLGVVAQALKQDALPPELQVLFVSVDPERDQQGRLAAYVGHYDKGLVGLTGAEANIGAFVEALGAAYERRDDGSGFVTFDHSTSLFVIGPDLRVIAAIVHPSGAEMVAQGVLRATQGSQIGLSVEGAWLLRGPPVASVLAGFLTVHNPGAAEVTIHGAESRWFDRVAFHETETDAQGRAHMRALSNLVVPAHGEALLRPGGKHLMLIGPRPEVFELERVPIALLLGDGSRVNVALDVRDH